MIVTEQGTGTPSIDIPQAIAEELELPPAMSPDWYSLAFTKCSSLIRSFESRAIVESWLDLE